MQKGPPVKPGALSSRKSMARETHDRPTACESRHHQLLSMQALRFISGAPLEKSMCRTSSPLGATVRACLLTRTIRAAPHPHNPHFCKRIVNEEPTLLSRGAHAAVHMLRTNVGAQMLRARWGTRQARTRGLACCERAPGRARGLACCERAPGRARWTIMVTGRSWLGVRGWASVVGPPWLGLRGWASVVGPPWLGLRDWAFVGGPPRAEGKRAFFPRSTAWDLG